MVMLLGIFKNIAECVSDPPKGKEPTSEKIFQTSSLGWCIEWVGVIVVNDGILLHNHIPRILKNHFRGKPYYVDLLELFNERMAVVHITTGSQTLDELLGENWRLYLLEEVLFPWLLLQALVVVHLLLPPQLNPRDEKLESNEDMSFSLAIQSNPSVGEAWKRKGQARVALGESVENESGSSFKEKSSESE